tara:strand:- start:2110 stop:2355 length:246 start_codon:yes stop_codon:yes gene_type:complete
MISTTEKEKIITVLGVHRYSKKISRHLNKKGILNQFNAPHSKSMIRQVMCGQKSHEEIEDAIWELHEIEKAKLEKREEILN